MKTVQEYMNDPRIVDDPEIAEAPEFIKEIYAIRLRIQDKTAGMTKEQLKEYRREQRERVDADCARLGFTIPYADVDEHGLLKSREMEAVAR
jgi:hypothetical protein